MSTDPEIVRLTAELNELKARLQAANLEIETLTVQLAEKRDDTLSLPQVNPVFDNILNAIKNAHRP
ncbi:MAG TPA: hypothetical protein VLH56_07405 [Dissulfurispiraceae bacterium]|nr:hypothetical protein [Dissulfurispiraceae bacterium]